MPVMEAADLAVKAIKRLIRDIKIPSLAELGVEEEKLIRLAPSMADAAIDSGSPANNPRKRPDRKLSICIVAPIIRREVGPSAAGICIIRTLLTSDPRYCTRSNLNIVRVAFFVLLYPAQLLKPLIVTSVAFRYHRGMQRCTGWPLHKIAMHDVFRSIVSIKGGEWSTRSMLARSSLPILPEVSHKTISGS